MVWCEGLEWNENQDLDLVEDIHQIPCFNRETELVQNSGIEIKNKPGVKDFQITPKS